MPLNWIFSRKKNVVQFFGIKIVFVSKFYIVLGVKIADIFEKKNSTQTQLKNRA